MVLLVLDMVSCFAPPLQPSPSPHPSPSICLYSLVYTLVRSKTKTVHFVLNDVWPMIVICTVVNIWTVLNYLWSMVVICTSLIENCIKIYCTLLYAVYYLLYIFLKSIFFYTMKMF